MKSSNPICVIATRRGMGDCISFFAFFKTIAKIKKKRIILITHKNTGAKEIFRDQNIFEDIIYLDKIRKNFISNILSYLKIFKLLNSLKKKGINEIIILHQSIKYVLLSRIIGFSLIEAPGQKFQRFFLKNNRVYKSYLSKILHPRDESEILIKKIFNIKKIENNYFTYNKSQKKSFIAIGIASSGYERFWGSKNYIKVINYLSEIGFKKFLLLSGKDQSLVEKKICSSFFKKNISFIKTSSLSLGNIVKYLGRAKLYVGNDTGFSHLAVSYQIPSIILHGDCPPHSYSKFIYPILGKNNIFSPTAIKTITAVKVINKIKYLVNKLSI